jgi:hypothetical protein
MSELEWLTSRDPWRMLAFLEPRASDRKLRLFAVACCHRALSLGSSLAQRALVDTAEHCAEGSLGEDRFEELKENLWETFQSDSDQEEWTPSRYLSGAAVHAKGGGSSKYAASFAARGLAFLAGKQDCPEWLAALDREHAAQCGLLREIFGSPFRPFRFRPAWVSNEGRAASVLASEIDATGRYEHMSRLADVLEWAGCHDQAVLDHCRAPEGHVRGCWVLDALFGRESAVREGLLTQADWQFCVNPAPMLSFLRDKGTARRWRLFAVACCRRIAHTITDERCLRAIDVAERYAAGTAGDEELRNARANVEDAWCEAKNAEYEAEAEEGFCMTPRYATFTRALSAVEAVRSALVRHPLTTDAEPGTLDAEFWRPTHEWAVAVRSDQIYERMETNDADTWQSEAVKSAVRTVEAAERRVHCGILRELFGEYMGSIGREGAWLPIGTGSQEAWCLLPMPVGEGK